MATSATTLESDIREHLQTIFTETTAPLVVVNPSENVLEALIIAATEYDTDLPEVRVLAAESILKTVVEDFIIASHAADLIADDTLALRTAPEISHNSLLVTSEQIIAFISIDGEIRGVASDESEVVEPMHETFLNEWETAEPFTLRTPPYSQVLDTLEEDIGTETKDDFVALLDSVESVRGTGDELDEVEISLLAAAKNEVLFYDIGKWGEDTGVASKATFSRVKTMLEDRGLVETEKVPIEVGRPRLRLRLATEDLQKTDIEELVHRVQEQLA
ncbi:transcriptional regulator TbsP [Haladaptatus halobius]|uniref:transcriptional regulator TbsP n=1 Tax=Haladaptatus halobius TaxID=2884875 RepID=UPI001D0B2686|nr:DUF5821 family protein [Haladaptatus halobius]